MLREALEVSLAERVVEAPTRKACEIARRFALNLEEATHGAKRMRVNVERGCVTLLEGPSGSGKTTLLRGAIREAKAKGWRVVEPSARRLRNRAAVDLVDAPAADEAARWLAKAGLGDARLFVRRASEMSAGELARLRLAMALADAAKSDGPALLAIDDFAQDLDVKTAQAVAGLLARAIRGTGVSAIVATTRAGLTQALSATTHMGLDLSGRVRVSHCEHARAWSPAMTIVRDASPRRWRDLAWAHYVGGEPVSVVERVAAVDPASGETLGVLVVCMATLNARWRAIAWPGRFDSGDKRADASAINRDLRRIARVVVEPRVRGLGVATALVRAYLEAPKSPCTEAIAAMGAFSGFFGRAGMCAMALPPNAADARLLDTLAHAGVEPWRLATPTSALQRAKRALGEGFLQRELMLWSVGARARCRRGDVEGMFRAACATVVSESVVFTHTGCGKGEL